MTFHGWVTVVGWGATALMTILYLIEHGLRSKGKLENANLKARIKGLETALDGTRLTARERMERINELLRKLSTGHRG